MGILSKYVCKIQKASFFFFFFCKMDRFFASTDVDALIAAIIGNKMQKRVIIQSIYCFF